MRILAAPHVRDEADGSVALFFRAVLFDASTTRSGAGAESIVQPWSNQRTHYRITSVQADEFAYRKVAASCYLLIC